jgi:uncharacterized protein (DUF362 family)/NAD-dependent dihydropyrimidine dehydrogenase PreA subunit
MKPIVSIVSCKTYDADKVEAAVGRAFALIGGLGQVVKPGMRVLLKPNLLSAKDPERAITTHPVIMRAVVLLVRALGAKPSIGDSQSDIGTPSEKVWAATGMQALARELDVPLVNFETSGAVARERGGFTYHIARPVLEADAIINLPKLKTHALMSFTGAIKNMYGAVPGFRKTLYHKESPYPSEFAQRLVDVYALARPQVTLVDGIAGLEGEGPSSRGRRREFGFLFAGFDGVAVDAVAGDFMGFTGHEVPTTSLAGTAGLGCPVLDQIEVAGEQLERIRLRDVQKPTYFRYLNVLPRRLVHTARHFVRVRLRANARTCTRCLVCLQNCPARAIRQEGTAMVVDDAACVRCLCCQELCPCGAMEIKRNWAARLFH